MECESTPWTHLVCCCWHLFVSSCSCAWPRGFPWLCGQCWGVGYCVPCLGFRLIADGVLCVFPPQPSVCLLFIFFRVMAESYLLQKITSGGELSAWHIRKNVLPKNVGLVIIWKLVLIISSEKSRSVLCFLLSFKWSWNKECYETKKLLHWEIFLRRFLLFGCSVVLQER